MSCGKIALLPGAACATGAVQAATGAGDAVS